MHYFIDPNAIGGHFFNDYLGFFAIFDELVVQMERNGSGFSVWQDGKVHRLFACVYAEGNVIEYFLKLFIHNKIPSVQVRTKFWRISQCLSGALS